MIKYLCHLSSLRHFILLYPRCSDNESVLWMNEAKWEAWLCLDYNMALFPKHSINSNTSSLAK